MDIGAWLDGLGLGRYGPAFRDAAIDAETLTELREEHLRELGLPLGHRVKLLRAIAQLRDAAATQAPPREQVAAQLDDAVPDAQAERRQLTVMFVDLAGSTELSCRLDAEDMREVIRSYQDAVAGEVARFGGHVGKFMGDGVLAYFGWPRVHEDSAERAVQAGLAIAAVVATLRAPDGHPLAARLGIATGVVVVGDLIGQGTSREEAVVGETPNLAARLQTTAPAGKVVVAARTRSLLGNRFQLAELGTVVLKGLPQPVPCWQVEADRTAITRFEARQGVRLAPMVGRNQELALLLDRWARARAGEGQAVMVLGEAGIGKSRLAVALGSALAGQDHLVLRYQCSPQHKDSPLWPVAEQLRWSAGLARESDEQGKLASLEALLRRAGPDPGEALPLLADLLGIAWNGPPVMLSAQEKRSRTLGALVDQLLGLARQKPVLLLFEDVHWIDPTTLDLAEQVLGAIGGVRVLALMTSRTDGQPALAGHPHLTRITLSRLDRDAAQAIVTGLAANRPLDDGVCRAILERAEGVPLFLEEVTRAMLDGDATAGTIPGSLHDWLMARLDRSPAAHQVAQVAACIGREFGHNLLAAVAGLREPELARALNELIQAELVFRRGLPPDATYSFKHALLRDAAHGSLLKSRRRVVHARIAQVLAEQFPELAQAAPEVIARHWAESGQMAEAAAWHQRAGEQALVRSATREAMAQLHAGLDALRTLPEGEQRQRRELELQAALGAALFAAKGQAAGETAIAYKRARELCRHVGESRRLVPVLFGLWASHNTRAELGPAEAIAGELLQLAQAQDDRQARLLGLRAHGTTLLFLGRLEEARSQLETLVELPAESDGPFGASLYPTDPRVTGRGFLAWILLMLGHPGQAVALVERALAEARALGHQPTLAVVLQCRCTVAQFLDDHPAVALHAEALLAACASQGFAFWSAMGEIFRGWALARGGDVAAGTRHIQAGIAAHQATEATLLSPHYLALLAEVQFAAGRADEASATLASALAGCARTGECWFDAELLRRQGELLAMTDPPQAEDHLRRALALANCQQARTWELRAATSLARLWAGRNEGDRARGLLGPVYAWFDEGLDVPDLQAARLLLESL